MGANLARAIETNVDFTAYVCDSASTVGAAVWGGAYGGPRHCIGGTTIEALRLVPPQIFPTCPKNCRHYFNYMLI